MKSTIIEVRDHEISGKIQNDIDKKYRFTFFLSPLSVLTLCAMPLFLRTAVKRFDLSPIR